MAKMFRVCSRMPFVHMLHDLGNDVVLGLAKQGRGQPHGAMGCSKQA
jgi:hypothetical protein